MGIGLRELLVILVIVLVVFGAKRLRNVGSDLGAAVKNFRSSMKEGEQESDAGDDGDKTIVDPELADPARRDGGSQPRK